MKVRRKRVCFSLLVVLFLVLSSLASAAEIPVFIPTQIKKLGLPEEPEIPTLTVIYDSIDIGNPCPVILDPEGKVRLQFSQKVDDCSMFFNFGIQFDWGATVSAGQPYFSGDAVHIPIDDTGYGEVSVDYLIEPFEENLGRPRYYVDVDNLSVRYDHLGEPTDIEMTNNVDYFCTGIKGASTTIHYQMIPVPTVIGVTDVWFVESVTTKYPEGNFIREVEVHFLNNADGTPNKYLITYEETKKIKEIRDGVEVEVTTTDYYTVEYYGKGKKRDRIHIDLSNFGQPSPRVINKPKQH